jgi:predicted transcriptional regulator
MNRQIVVLNGNPESGENELNQFLTEVVQQLKNEDLKVVYHELSEKNIRQCVGCWDCWWKTPGLCRFADDTAEILKDMINSGLVIFASPLLMGMYSALLKKFHDRAIPLVHPYIEIINNECHHRKRYPEYPVMGVLVDKKDATPEEIDNTKFIFSRIAINLHSEVKFFYSIQQKNPKELSYEISDI